MNIKAKIFPDNKSKNKEALWLYVSRTKEKSEMVEELKDILGVHREEDSQEDLLHAILDDEVRAIRDACDEWLKDTYK